MDGVTIKVMFKGNEHPVLRPPVHSGVYSVPVAKPAGQPSPLAPLLGDIQHGVQHLKVGQPHVATLNREDWSYAFVLSFCNFHTCIVSNSGCFV